jgi:hypothetical protein
MARVMTSGMVKTNKMSTMDNPQPNSTTKQKQKNKKKTKVLRELLSWWSQTRRVVLACKHNLLATRALYAVHTVVAREVNGDFFFNQVIDLDTGCVVAEMTNVFVICWRSLIGCKVDDMMCHHFGLVEGRQLNITLSIESAKITRAATSVHNQTRTFRTVVVQS